MFRDTHKLPPGHFAVFESDGRSHIDRYWSIVAEADQEPLIDRSKLDLLAETKATLAAAVRRRLMGDVPVGAFLSGGIDSSLIVALMKESSAATVRTFTIGFLSNQFDESEYAQQVAHRLGVKTRD